MIVVTNLSGNSSNDNWTSPSQQTTIGDYTNPKFVRALTLTNKGLITYRPNIVVGIPTLEILKLAVNTNPNLTWVPIILSHPGNVTTNHSNNPNSASFNIAANCENFVTLNYQWQKSTDNGGNWTNQANGGVYSGMTTNTMSISNTNGLNGYYFRCRPYNVAGTSNSNAGILTVL